MKKAIFIMMFSLIVLPGFVLSAPIEEPAPVEDPPQEVLTEEVDRGLIPCEGTDCNSCHLVVLAENILGWLIGVMLVIFAITTAWAGFSLVTSGGNTSAKTEAKQKMTNALIGILIVMGAWLLVDTLMKSLLLGGEGELNNRPWSTLECIEQNDTVPPSKVFQQNRDLVAMGCTLVGNIWKCLPSNCTYSVARGETEEEHWDCPNGVDPPKPPITPGLEDACFNGCRSLADAGVPCKNSNTCSVSPITLDKLVNFHAEVSKTVVGARVTEAMPPTPGVNHKNPCHQNGTCVDYGVEGGMKSTDDIVSVIKAAYRNGLTAKYEVATQAEADALVKDAKGRLRTEDVQVVGYITAPHFSVYDK
ncbi:hypothetical protein H6785_01740 [Candidatus Nomurabacteria bacterium]|nr:hypothetical protein [Candidatus Kaiserbacteria bacterium]MCB9815283.1 hypothetical protein [Candidatus Nomurabacteria bacterium]